MAYSCVITSAVRSVNNGVRVSYDLRDDADQTVEAHDVTVLFEGSTNTEKRASIKNQLIPIFEQNIEQRRDADANADQVIQGLIGVRYPGG